MNYDELRQAQATMGCLQLIGIITRLIFASILGGTWRTKVEYSQSTQVSGSNFQVIPFQKEIKQHHFLGGLVSNGSIKVNEIAGNSIREGDQIVELNVKSAHTATDLLVTLITLGIYSPITVEVEGQIMDTN